MKHHISIKGQLKKVFIFVQLCYIGNSIVQKDVHFVLGQEIKIIVRSVL